MDITMNTMIEAGDFKGKCLKLLDDVARTREPLIITKHGKAVAKLVVHHEGDILSPLEDA